MQKRWLIAAAMAVTPLVSAAEQPVDGGRNVAAAPAPRIAQDKLDRIRQSLVAQIAAWEPGEQAMRAPTAGEAAALASPAGEPVDVMIPLARGGVALRPDIAHASLAVAVRGDDGKVTVAHETPAKTGSADVKKGAAHAH